MKLKMKKIGFTLIELMIVISVIGILSTIGMASFQNSQRRSRDAKRKADLEIVRSALEMYRSDLGVYPNTGDLDSLVGTYLSSLPLDPKYPLFTYQYKKTEDGGYCLGCFLEAETTNNCPQNKCGDLSLCLPDTDSCNYCLINP